MADVKPLVFSSASGTPEVLQATDVLTLPAPVRFDGLVGFNGVTPVATPQVGGTYSQSLGQLITALTALGLVQDRRGAGWNISTSLDQLLALGPYEPGRLIIGGVGGWQQLDMPAVVPGVIQVPTAHAGRPERNGVTGLTVNQLAYSPILAYGPVAPSATNPQTGALWFDSSPAAPQLKVWDGSSWQPVLQGLLGSIAQTSGTGVLYLDRGAASLSSTAAAGRSLASAGSGSAPVWVDWISTSTTPPWVNGVSATAPRPAGGNRPVGVTSAIWANPARNAESIGFWDEADQQWKSVYVNNPVLNALGNLRSTLANGDLFTVVGGQVVRLGAGAAGTMLTSTGTGLQWSQRFSRSPAAPPAPASGDLWLESGTALVHVYDGSRWVALVEPGRVSGVNASSSNLQPGVPLLHTGTGWVLADGRSAASGAQVLGVAIAQAVPGTPVAVATSGVIEATAAQWYAVIDGADGNPVNSGLTPGASYYLSGTAAGVLSVTAGPGRVLIGTALDSTHLLLQIGQQQSLANGRVHQGATAPVNAVLGELWFNTSNQQLAVAVVGAGGSGLSWQPISSAPAAGGAGGGAGGAAALTMTDMEAIDWIADPRSAALRFFKSDGSSETIRVKGTGSAVVTMSDDHTLVIDAAMPATLGSSIDGGRFSP